MSLSYPGFLLKGGTICDLIRLHSHWELSPLLPVPPLGHIYSRKSSSAFTAVGNLLLFRLIHRWDKIWLVRPHPLSQPLGVSSSSAWSTVGLHRSCATSSAFTAVGNSPLPPDPPLGHISLVQPLPLSQPLGVSSSSAWSTVRLYKSRPHRFSVGASRHPVTPAAARRHCIGLAVERLFNGSGRWQATRRPPTYLAHQQPFGRLLLS